MGRDHVRRPLSLFSRVHTGQGTGLTRALDPHGRLRSERGVRGILMSLPQTSSRRTPRRRSRRDREGAVLLVVLLVVLIITSSLTVAVRSTQSEVRAAGEERVLRQTRASAEAAMTTTIAWIDMLGDAGQWV